MEYTYLCETFASDEEAVVLLAAEEVVEFEAFWHEQGELYQRFQANMISVEFIPVRHQKRKEILTRFQVEGHQCFLYLHRPVKKRDEPGVVSFYVLMKMLIRLCQPHEVLEDAQSSSGT
jgi:hypothetical protein